MGILNTGIIGKLVKRIVKGAVSPVTSVIRSNIDSSENGQGKFDFIRILSSGVTIVGVFYFLHDKINTEKMEQLIKLLVKLF